MADRCWEGAWRVHSGTGRRKRFPGTQFRGGQAAKVTIPCVARSTPAKAYPPAVEIPVTRIRASSPIRPDQSFQSTLTKDSNGIHTPADDLEIPSVPESPEIVFFVAGSRAI